MEYVYFNQSSNRFFDTCTSEVLNKTLFNARYCAYLPDLFLLLFFISLFLTSGIAERIFLCLFLYETNGWLFGLLLMFPILSPLVYLLILKKCHTEYSANVYVGGSYSCLFHGVLIISGFDAVLIGGRILLEEIYDWQQKESEDRIEEDMPCISYPFFQLSHEKLSIIKNYCYLSIAFKVIPYLLITPMMLLVHKSPDYIVAVAASSIVLNMLIFSLMIAITLPIRKTPRVFTDSYCVLMNSFSKFMATFCSCGVNIAIFAMIFNSVGYMVFFIIFLRFFTFTIPCWSILKNYCCPCLKIYYFYGLYFAAIFSFIYIHPIEGLGKLQYYFTYLLNFLVELACIFLLSTAEESTICTYFGLRVVVVAFVSCFGLINILYKEECFVKTLSKVPEVNEKEPKPTQRKLTARKLTGRKLTEPKRTEPKRTEPKRTEPKAGGTKSAEPKRTEPKADGTKSGWNQTDRTKTDGIKATEPKRTEPKADGTKPTEPKRTEPKADGIKPTEPKLTEPKADGTKPTEPKRTEPKADGINPTEPKRTEPTADGIKPTEPKLTEPKADGTKPTEPKRTEPKADGIKPTEPKRTEPTADGTKPTEPKRTEPKADGIKPTEPKRTEPTADGTKPTEPKRESNK